MAINQFPCLGIAGELYMPSTGRALKTIRPAYLLVSQLEIYWDVTSSKCFHYPLDHIWLGDTLHSRWGCDSVPCLSVGKLGSRAGKTPYLRI